jgi:DNA segregation ATPase FtsK/SpoIIIE-like protein
VRRAMEIIRATGNASTSLLQRKLKIGYLRRG